MIHYDWPEKKVKKECCAQMSVKRKKEDNHKFPKTLYKLEHLSVFFFKLPFFVASFLRQQTGESRDE